MKILILLRDLSPNGITTYNRILARALGEQGHEVHVWPSDESFGSRSSFRLPLLHPWLAPLVRRRLDAVRPDVVLAHHYTQARLAQRLKISAGLPWVAVMHNSHAPARMAQWAELFGSASGVVTLCETLRARYSALAADAAAGGARQPPVLLSRLPIDPVPARRQRRAGAALTLAYVARLSGQKGPRCEAWLQAIATLPERDRCKVLVIGDGSYLARLRRTAAELALAVEFTGMLADPGTRLDEVDIITGAGYALMEGLVRGCAPVALGFGGCFGALTEDNLEQAFAVNFGDQCVQPYPSDVPTIAHALRAAIDAIGSAAETHVRQRCIQRFQPAPIAAELVDFLRQVAPADSRGGVKDGRTSHATG